MRGSRWRDDWINGILWRLWTGAPWRDLRAKHELWKMHHERLQTWTPVGTWERILDHVEAKDDSIGKVEWIFSIDSTNVLAYQHAVGA